MEGARAAIQGAKKNKTVDWSVREIDRHINKQKKSLKNRQNKYLNVKRKLNGGQKNCRMLPLEHSEILLACIKQ